MICASSIAKKRDYLLVYLAVFAQGLAYWGMPLYDPDLGFHLLGGAWVFKYHDVPRADFINVLNPTWVDYHWLGQLLIYWIYTILGYPGVQAVAGLIGGALGILLLQLCRASYRNLHPLVALASVSALLWLLYGTVATRPTCFGVLLCGFSLLLLLRRRERSLPWLFCLAVTATNIHVYWILIPVLWGLCFCLPRLLPIHLPRKATIPPKKAWFGLGLLLSAGLISPYGIFNPLPGISSKLTNYYVLADVALNPSVLKKYVTELIPGFLCDKSFLIFTLVLLPAVFRFYSTKRLKVKYYELFIFLASFILFIEGLKYQILFAISLVPITIPMVAVAYRRLDKWTGGWIDQLKTPLITFALIVQTTQMVLTVPFIENNSVQALESLEYMEPIAACSFIRSLDITSDRIIKVGSPYDLGGWCAWMLHKDDLPNPLYRMTFDGRTQFVPVQDIVDGFDMFSLKGSWEKTLKKTDPDLVLVPREAQLGRMLIERKSDWRLIHADDHFGVFAKTAILSSGP